MRKIKLALVGANGRMGKEISDLLVEKKTFLPVVAITRSGGSQVFKKTIHDLAELESQDVDVILDFSAPDVTRKCIEVAVKKKIPLVTGVTGFTTSDLNLLRTSSKKTAILWSPNMSLGIAVLKKTISALSQLKDFDFQVLETHHSRKKDKPSGTAIALQGALEKALKKKLPEPLSIRAGGVVGNHSVFAVSEEEELEFTHRALSRTVFAKGALRAVEWIAKRNNGLFTIEDVIQGG